MLSGQIGLVGDKKQNYKSESTILYNVKLMGDNIKWMGISSDVGNRDDKKQIYENQCRQY